MRKERMDSLDTFNSTLVDIFESKPEVRGKVDLQKTIYLAKRLGAPVPFSFRWNIFGPYSSELAHYADHLVIEGLLKYPGKYKLNSEIANSYVSRLKSEAAQHLRTFFKNVKEICDKKNYDHVLFLECVASLDFIRTNVSKRTKRTKKRVFILLEKLKPTKKEIFVRMREDAWKLLLDANLIK